jgi:hypothetical protein
MKRFSQQFKKKSDTIRLRASERGDLRDRLTSYMEYHPLPADRKASKSVSTEGFVSESSKRISISMTYVRGFAGAFAAFMIVAVPVVAERSVPGDMLYAVKTNITEEVRASLILSPYAKVEWETERLERRVAEARLLATEGKLTPEAEAEVAQAVKEHTDAAQEGIASMRETDEDEAALAEITFASAMEVQSDVLAGTMAKEPDSVDSVERGQSIVVLAGIVNGVRDHASVAQAGSKPSYTKLLANVESQTTRVYELFESVKQQAGDEEILNIERRLEDIGRKVATAIDLHANEPKAIVKVESVIEEMASEDVPAEEEELVDVAQEVAAEAEESSEDTATTTAENEPKAPVEEDIDEAVVEEVVLTDEERNAYIIALLREALTGVQKLIIFMTDIDVRENVTIDELLPVTFTEQERTDTILNQLDVVLLIQADIERVVITDAVREQVLLSRNLLAEQLESLTQMLEAGSLSAAEENIAAATVITDELRNLTVDLPRIEDTEEVVQPEVAEDGEKPEEVDEEGPAEEDTAE